MNNEQSYEKLKESQDNLVSDLSYLLIQKKLEELLADNNNCAEVIDNGSP